jgi:hypothetical protein
MGPHVVVVSSPRFDRDLGARVRLPFFSGHLFQDVDVQRQTGHQLLQPAILVLELPQPLTSAGSNVPKCFRHP